MRSLAGRSVIVTGGGSGIGREIALAFARHGSRTAVIGRTEAKLSETCAAAAGLPGEVHSIVADVTDEASVDQAFGRVDQLFGGCEILVNSAGSFEGGGPVVDLPMSAWQQVIDVNVTGMFLCAKQAFTRMIPAGGGRVINIGSIAGRRPRLHSVAYSTSKFAVRGMTQALAIEGREHSIAVSVINPGNTAVARRTDRSTTTGSYSSSEPEISTEAIAETALLMGQIEDGANVFDATVLPIEQDYLGRG